MVLIGLPGAGKSTLARALCREHGFTRVDRDAIRWAAKNKSDPIFGKAAANEAVWRAAAKSLRARHDVVIDGMTFASRAERRRARVLTRKHGARFLPVFLDCPVALAQERVARDSDHPAGDRKPDLVSEVARRFERVAPGTPRLDARWRVARQLARVRARLR